MSYHWIIFDADGTLFDFDRAEAGALQETFDAFGMVFEQRTGDLYHQINGAIWRELEQGAITPEALRVERFRRLFDALNLAIDPAAFSGRYLDHLSHRGDLIDGAEEVVKALHRPLPPAHPDQRAERGAAHPAGSFGPGGILRGHRHLR